MGLDRFDAWWSGLRYVRRSVVLRLLGTVLAFSCAITLILTAVQLFRDYQRGFEQIQNSLVDIDRSYRDSLGEALWRLDQRQLQLKLEGMLRLRDIRAAEVRELPPVNSSIVVSVGERERISGMRVAREFPIVYRVQDKIEQIGMLYVEATLANLYHDLTRTALVILVSQGANTFLVALFTFYILWRLLTRHLAAIARSVSDYDFHEPPSPFVLQRKPPREPDELDRVVSAFNAMAMRLHRAYLDEREAAVEREARHMAEAANRAKGEFLANLSHELRTPLNGILGYAQILRRDSTLSLRQRDGVAVIQQSGEHLLALIDETLDFAKVEAGKLRIEICDVPLAGLVDTIREIIGVKAEQRKLAFECTVAADAPGGVRADEHRLRQVLLNLLSNAVKFTDEGSVRLFIGRAESGAARFEVHDTGIGIAAEYHEKIFMPFEQAGGAERRAGGTGLGLAISRQFVRAMGGEVKVESEVGRGSVFWFELPPALVEPRILHVTSGAAIITGYQGPRRKVLVIDDVQINRAVIVELLTRIGFDTVESASGADGIALAQTESPDLILTDIVMPGIDGLTVTRRFRAMPAFARTPIIAISASPCGVDGARSLEAGANAFISKPLDFDVLLARIAALLGIDWIREAVQPPAGAPMPATFPVNIPADAMSELHQLARDGNMSGIVQWAERMAAIDPAHAAFAARLHQLARAWQSKAILQLVERYLEGNTAS
ncbi:hybrid sensor histidine kinase/response regulator [Paraburkholderia caribensis]|uniref:hybrid sensor histidine kinase/response regulator n=1 Tax=Paraburkholderia caribensis TaxID=75105 RepID=UPI0007202253|nr:hybrid sensor histidine kinase/response regulator [Paraburkholderia caribensis]ALP68031.1 histidine kinase [Paraburkholderia caribensis]AUT56242.1 hybrid sensor histidine kinase/response regulator [Paraburkholderia caribensis]